MVQGLDNHVNFCGHIGGAHYVSVTSGYKCVDLRQWYQPYFTEDCAIKPTKKGVALRLDEWSGLCSLINVINDTYPTLGIAQPCYYKEDPINHFFQCRECNPFVNHSPVP